jgi:beta-phosphoglucomutase-like phosphatase (HAD superfamily)
MEDLYWPMGIPRTATRADLNAIRTRYILERWDIQALKPEAVQTVQYFRRELGMKCAVVSGEFCPLLIKGVFEAGLIPHFDYIRADASPKDVELLNACKTLGVAPERAFYVDDSFEGVGSGGYATEDRILAAQPNHIVHNLDQLVEFVTTA